MYKEAIQYKHNFIKECEKYQLPLHNKAVFLTEITKQCKEHPTDDHLHRMLMAAVCDCDLLFDHFYPEKSTYEWECEYASLLTNLRMLEKALTYEKQLQAEWEKILDRKTIPVKFETSDPEHVIDTETTFLVSLFRQIFKVSETKSRYLYDNLHELVRMTRSFPLLRRVAPLFFYQTMICHTSRIAINESFTTFSLSSLWKYKQYAVLKNNAKNYDTYKNYSKLFRRLLKFYKRDTEINRNLCRYGFCACSNLVEWIAFMQEKKHKKFLTPLMRFYRENPQTYCESYDSTSEFSVYHLFHIKEKKENQYFMELMEHSALDKIEYRINRYLAENTDCLTNCMNNLYRDAGNLKSCIKMVYQQSQVESIFPEQIPLPYRLSILHDLVTNYIDEQINQRVQEVVNGDGSR